MDSKAILVGNLYRSALVIETERFRPWALTRLGTVLAYDAALWATGAEQGNGFRIHDMSVIGMADEVAHNLTDPARDPFFAACLQSRGRVMSSLDWCRENPDESWRADSSGMHCGIAVHQHRPFSGLVSVLHLYRRDSSGSFSQDDAGNLEDMAYHMDDAGSLSFFVHLGQPPKIPRRKFAAVCDRHGILREAQERFLEMLREHYPGWNGPELPFEVPDPQEGQVSDGSGLNLQSEAVGDWRCLRIWEAGPLDTLSDREREIVTAICQGLTLKEGARRFGIAPSTVSNHLYRAYEKLGVSSREELRRIVKPVTFT